MIFISATKLATEILQEINTEFISGFVLKQIVSAVIGNLEEVQTIALFLKCRQALINITEMAHVNVVSIFIIDHASILDVKHYRLFVNEGGSLNIAIDVVEQRYICRIW